jgi:anaerobic magnesium-protoporphyrin IX monomethyl ester cyclase
MRIFLIYPNDFQEPKKSVAERVPLGLLYIASYLKSKDKELNIKIIDSFAEKLSLGETLKRILEYKPDLVGINVITYFVQDVLSLSKLIKKSLPGTKIVCGGIHADAKPQELVSEKFIDFVITGEAELSFYFICQYLKGKCKIEDVPGLYFKEKGIVKRNNKTGFIKKLDELPFPNRSLINQNIYYPLFVKKTTSIMGSRGCSFSSCIFCALALAQRIRRRSPDNIIEEIKECMRRYNINSFTFIDPLFVSSKKHTKELCKKIINEDLRITWRCQTRADSFFPTGQYTKKDIIELLALMKKSGCEWIFFGLESGSQHILNLNNKKQNLKQVEIAINLVKKSGINIHAAFVLGLFGETQDTLRKTFEFARKLRIRHISFITAMPLPGTEFYEKVKNNIVGGERYWMSRNRIIRRGVIKYDGFTTKDLEKIARQTNIKIKLHPSFLIGRLTSFIKTPTRQNIRYFFNGAKAIIRRGI